MTLCVFDQSTLRSEKKATIDGNKDVNKTSVGSVKLGKALDFGSRLSPRYSVNLLPTGREG